MPGQLDALQKAPHVEAVGGEVVVRGPRVALTLTAAAAAETARLLAEAAIQAQSQQSLNNTLGLADLGLRVKDD